MITENLSTLKINKLSQELYDKALKEGKINDNEIYLTPDEPIIVEQEVIESANPVSSKAVYDEINALQTYIDDAYDVADGKQDTITYKNIEETRPEISVEANTFYICKAPLEDLRLQFGNEFFALRFTVGTSFQYDFLYGASGVSPKFIGKAPDFQEGETWELNIMDGIVASGKVVIINEPSN